VLAVELAVRLLVQLGLLERDQLAFGQHAAVLGQLGFQGFQPLLHGLQVVAQPDAADTERRDLGAALLQLVGSPRLAPSRLVDGHRHHGGFHVGRGTVLQVGLGPGDLGQRQIAAFLIEVSKAIETVAAVAHHPAGLGHAAQLLGQLQKADFGLDHFALGCRHDGLSGHTGRGAALRLWLRAPALPPPIQAVRQIMSRLLH
jgi:hypothetical protein